MSHMWGPRDLSRRSWAEDTVMGEASAEALNKRKKGEIRGEIGRASGVSWEAAQGRATSDQATVQYRLKFNR